MALIQHNPWKPGYMIAGAMLPIRLVEFRNDSAFAKDVAIGCFAVERQLESMMKEAVDHARTRN